jgi:hypothetical protein
VRCLPSWFIGVLEQTADRVPSDIETLSAVGRSVTQMTESGSERVILALADPPLSYARVTMAASDDALATQHKEWFSRSFLVGVAAAASFPVEVTLNDVNGVDATVHDGGITTDWQLKGTSSPEFSKDGKTLFFDLDVRTYNLFTGTRNSSGYLGVVVVPDDDAKWAAVSKHQLVLRHCGYWTKVTGLAPSSNKETVRIHLPISQKLNVAAIKKIMQAERKRITS